MGEERPDLGVTDGCVSEWTFFQDHAEAHLNRESWLYLEIIKVAVQDAVRGIQAGIVDPVTFQPKFVSIMREDMAEWQHGATFLKSPACLQLCQHINAWSEGILKTTPETFVRVAKTMARKRNQNKAKR